MSDTIINRDFYIDAIEKSLGKGLIIVLVGQRRVGKSFILQTLYKIKSAENDSNLIYVDKEKREFDNIYNYQELNIYIESHFDYNKHNYILIDEVQDIESFEKTIRSWRVEANTDVIITGSNAKMLSSDLSTLIGGRYKEILISPLNYTEWLRFFNLNDSDDNFAKFINIGGLPGLYKIGLELSDARSYQMDVYHTVLLKDVVIRNNLRNVAFLEKLVQYVADNIGKLFSANSISKYMKSMGQNISPALIIDYLDFLCSAYIINKVKRYDIHGKRIFDNNDKYYFSDHGIRNAIAGGSREGDIEKILENIVYQELKHLGYDIYVGQLQAGEVDFVCTKPDGTKIYIQVSYIVSNEETRLREFGALKQIKDNYPKYLISMTPLLVENDEEGIKHIHLRKFLTSGLDISLV